MSVRRWFEVGAITVALGIIAVLIWLLRGAHDMALASGQPMFGDYIAFWSAGRAALEGHVAEVHQRAIIWTYHQEAGSAIRFYAGWNSPPTFLLVVAPLALLPYPASALLFLAATAALYIYAAGKLLPDARALIFALTLPAAVYHLGTVQVGLLVAGVTGLALYWLDKRPRAAGALIAVLAIKPHLALLWPLMLALTGRWRAFFAAAIATIAFAGAGALAFGVDSYARFLANLASAENLISAQRITTPSYASLYGNLLQLHASHAFAIAAQALSATAALILGIFVFRRGDARAQGAALCAATLLVTPYAFFYDFTLLAVGAAMLGVPRNRFETIAFTLAWSAGLSLAVGYFIAPVPLCPLAAWAVLLAAVRRAGSAEPRLMSLR